MNISRRFLKMAVAVSLVSSVNADAAMAEAEHIKRVYAHMLIEDLPSASEEMEHALRLYPSSKALLEAQIKVLAKAGDEKGMIKAWNSYIQAYPDEQENHEIIENMAWSVVDQGFRSSSPLTRIYAMLAAFFAQDAKSVIILQKGLQDTNGIVRGIAVQLAGKMRDAKLCDEMLRLFRTETAWPIHLEAIKAIGSMHIMEAQPDLIAIISNNKSMAEEKAAAIQALVNMRETADRNEVVKLAGSDRAGLRLLACQVVAHFDLTRDVDQIIPLLKDNRAEVRAAAISTLGMLRLADYEGTPFADLAKPLLQDPDEIAAITAAWALTLDHPMQGQQAFEPWLSHENRDIRLLAAEALASTGSYGTPLALKTFKETKDPFVRMNLALGLLTQQVEINAACEALYQGLGSEKGRWMWKEQGNFRVLAPSDLKHNEMIPNYPEAENQLVRLEVLNSLAIMKYPHAQEAIKRFLQERTWGITGMASALLLTEGDETAVDLVQGLLTDPNPKVRLQAAQVLALWGAGESAINVLKQAYEGADNEIKEKILEAVGRVGNQASIPFLVDQLKEAHQSLRIIAASSILQCLYN